MTAGEVKSRFELTEGPYPSPPRSVRASSPPARLDGRLIRVETSECDGLVVVGVDAGGELFATYAVC